MASPKVTPHSHDLHFSHEHPLQHKKPSPEPNTSCFGCKGVIFPGNDFYECKKCIFSLHQVCHDMPIEVEHPSDPNHRFTLESTPISAEDMYNCKACGHHISGFYYNCVECKDYYHILCLMAPLSVKISSHVHSVKLEFSPPYDFECDLCKEPSYSGWLYRCGSCEFDAHINCAIKSKGEEWKEEGSMARDKGHELMELIAQGMNGSDHLHHQVHPGQLSPSYQFSEALFSIDFAKTLLRDEYIGQENKGPLEKVNENSIKSESRETTPKKPSKRNSREPTAESEIIGSASKNIGGDHIWSEIGRESEKRKSRGHGNAKADLEKRKPETDCLESSCWSSLSFCLCCQRSKV